MEASCATHVFEVPNYSLRRDLGVRGFFLRSATFHAGGCAWSLRVYPCGYVSPDHMAVMLELMTGDAVVTASHDMGLAVPDDASEGHYPAIESETAEFNTRCRVEGFMPSCWLVDEFIGISELEASPFLRGDRLVLECSVRVIKATLTVDGELTVPPSELSEDMGRLMDGGDGADVTFDVQGESFRAHRNVLMVRTTPAFRAMLEGPTKDDGFMNLVPVDDVKPAVFEAVLRYVYTDRLRLRQAMDELSKDSRVEMAHGLLAAANRFDMGRFKILCEQTLSKSLEVETVAATLVLTERYNCAGLRDACIEFMISGRMDDVAATEGYAVLKADHPYLLVGALEKAGKLGKI
ncbi:unnamed protein product [Urochloa decumbens]|uniref:Uncharacterized protein n=1 Tax=Urochloa decumbens TaxID=240449 RepID=A0ABC9C337_9POAL